MSVGLGRLLVFAYSFSLWIPAFGVPASATRGVQLAEPLSAVVAVWLLVTRVRDKFGPAAILSLLTVFAIALNWIAIYLVGDANGQAGAILAYYLAIVLPALLCGVLIFTRDDLSRAFVRGAIAGATFTAVLCLLQVVLPREVTDLRNNLSFRLPPQFNRSFGLFPEASIAAGMLTFAIAVATAGLVNRDVRERFLRIGPFKGTAWAGALLVLFLLALGSTRSSSVLVMLPLLAGIAFLRFFQGSASKKAFYLSAGAALLAAAGAVYYLAIYRVRMENSAAIQSASDRFVSLVGAYDMLKDSHFLGAGLGANNDIGAYAERAARQLGLTTNGEVRGVNSFVFGRCLEEGLLMIAVFAIVAVRIGRALWRDCDATSGVLALLALNSMLNALWIAGYRGLLMSWLLIPLAFTAQPIR